MSSILISLVICCIVLPGFVCAVEYWHGWSKLYNKLIPTVNKLLKKNYPLRSWTDSHNTVTHQFKTFCVWLAVGGILFVATQVV